MYVGECPVEPAISFGEALRDRAYWLVGLLLMQSFSGIILSRNEALLADHPVIIFFLTMLGKSWTAPPVEKYTFLLLLISRRFCVFAFPSYVVGVGGNAGNQASVRGTFCQRIQDPLPSDGMRPPRCSLLPHLALPFGENSHSRFGAWNTQ